MLLNCKKKVIIDPKNKSQRVDGAFRPDTLVIPPKGVSSYRSPFEFYQITRYRIKHPRNGDQGRNITGRSTVTDFDINV